MNSAVPSPYPAQGEEIDGRYRVERVLGEGGMGMVARAVDLLMRQTVAIKFMNPQFMTFPGAIDRFIREAQASVAIKSEHVVHTLNVGKLASGAPYMVMPCLEGKDLADLLAQEGQPGLPTARAIHFTLQVLRGLQAAHAVGIVHRDMKPSNCFVVKHEGEGDFVKILDFGISKVAQQPGSASLTQTNSALGTPLYMSPEQAKSPRDVDARSDIYSVGVILYELLTGHTPFFSESGEFTEILFKLFTAEPPPVKSTRPDLPDALATAVHKALSRDLDVRFASAADMAAALAPFADERSSHILTRIKNFTPEQARSMPPPQDMSLPASMEVFSRLDAKPSTDVMANRPTTDVQRSAPFTHAMDGAPGRIIVTPATPVTPPGASVAPAAANARVTGAADMMARTQMDSVPETPQAAVAIGASTDLGATRDAPMEAPAPRRSPIVYLMPVFALFAVIGAIAIFAASKMKSPDTKTVATGEPPTVSSSLPPPASASAAPSAEPSSAPSAVASAAPSASALIKTVTPTVSATTKTPPKGDPNLVKAASTTDQAFQ